MRSLVLLSCLLLAVAGQEEGCSMDDFLRCDREIQSKLANGLHPIAIIIAHNYHH